jgi:RHS repeat-associated protein
LSDTPGCGAGNEYIYFAGRRTAWVDSGGTVRYYWGDHLGTTRIVTDASGNVCYDADYYPCQGERTPYVNTCTPAYKMAGMKFDQESGDYYTLNRYYPPNLGRWMSPDPLAGDITNPQSLNRYAYVSNNPMTLIYPLGLEGKSNIKLQAAPQSSGCTLNGIYTACYVVASLVGAGAAYPLPPPYEGWEPVSGGAQPDCPGCYYETWGPFKDAIWDPDNPDTWGLWGIFWTQTSNTTWTFQSPLSFQETVETFKNVGIAPSPIDNKYNPFHGTDFNLRDFSPVCSVHVTLASDGTGSAHLDAFNPAYNVPSYPVSGEGVQGGSLLLHGVADVAPWWIGTKTGLSIPGAGSLCH